jgi:hypothetical protein
MTHSRSQLYIPCVIDWDTNTVSKPVGPPMRFPDAVDYLKAMHSGAWMQSNAAPVEAGSPLLVGCEIPG